MISNRTRRDFKKKPRVTYRLVKGILEVATFTLPGIRGPKIVYKGAKAAQKFLQNQKVQKQLVDRQMRRAEKMEAGEDIMSDGRKLSDVMKKLGAKQ